MTDPAVPSADVRCPGCGAAATGRFCSDCGALVREGACELCGQSLQPGARFCNNCGSPVGAAVGGAVAKRRGGDGGTAKLVSGAAILALIAFVAGEGLARRAASSDTGVAQQASVGPAVGPSAPDISNMSPEERASRLFNRVMSYSEQGKMDSARFFAPMAIQAYQMIGPLDAHARYDIGAISAAVGETAMARMEADSILAAQPTNLLGLVLAIKAATMAGDSNATAGFLRRLVAAAPSERAKGTKEYGEHGHDIDEALKKAGASP